MKPELTQARLHSLMIYDPFTGEFRWRVNSRRARAGDIAGCLSRGYVVIRFDGRQHRAHRLAVLYMTGTLPKDEIDHWDLDKANNRWLNLREATHTQNMTNRREWNKLGIKGVYPTQGGTFRAQITIKGRQTHLGCFATAADAKVAYDAAANQNYGAFARSA